MSQILSQVKAGEELGQDLRVGGSALELMEAKEQLSIPPGDAYPKSTCDFGHGLVSANIGSVQLEARERIVGITSVFTGDGNYFLFALSKAVPYNQDSPILRASLRNTLNSADFRAKDGQPWTSM